jgi:HSP20 family protein
VEDIMARKQENDLLIEDELAAAFLNDEQLLEEASDEASTQEEGWEETNEEFPGQLAVDVFETADKLVVKARTAGVDKKDLDVSISDNILTVSGTLNSGDSAEVANWHIQECYWGEFSRTIALPTPIKEDGVEAVLKDGVLTITFDKVKEEKAKKIKVL